MAAKKKPEAEQAQRSSKPRQAGKPPRKAAGGTRLQSTQGRAPAAARSRKAVMGSATAAEIYRVLRERHADAHCELDHTNPFELIVATVLSAQSTDVMVNKVTPELFQRWPGPTELAAADPRDVEKVLSKLGMFRQKTRSIVGLSKLLVEKHAGAVPRTLAELVQLPGVGRKTANVVLGVAFGTPEGVVVDTHVQRLSQRLGLTRHSEPADIERDLMRLYDRSLWDPLSHTLIFHGRRLCTARKPACAACPAQSLCPSAFRAELVGRKASAPPRRKA